MRWYNFFHIYQPPHWNEKIIRRVADEAYRPLLRILQSHPDLKITVNITGSLTEQLAALQLHDILENISAAIQRGQIELVGSVMYHPIVPLIPRAERQRQFSLQADLHKRIFGVRSTSGCYLPEMAFDPSIEQDIIDQGFSWVLLDEEAAGQGFNTIPLERPYITPLGLKVIFRNRFISDWMSFRADPKQPELAREAIAADKRSQQSLVTALDGENLGHHRHGADLLWEKLVTGASIETDTLSSFAQLPATPIQPLAGSWSSLPSELAAHIPFGLWNHPTNPIHQAQWELTHTVIQIVQQHTNDPYYGAARRLLDPALASDRYWWASAQPWWDATIVLRETQRLVDVISPLSTLAAPLRSKVTALGEQVNDLVHVWESTGVARRRQSSYLQDTGDVRYMAGNQLYG